MPFTFTKTKLPEVFLIEAKTFPDNRGSFMESFKSSEFKANGIKEEFLQDNFPISIKNVIRGLHFQKPPFEQGKLILVVKGKIWDVAVDVRKSSPTFGQWLGEELSESNHRMLYIPPGFAHGFAVLEDDTRVVYKMSVHEYAPAYDSGVCYNDPDINIPWPVESPIVSEKDTKLPFLKDAEVFE